MSEPFRNPQSAIRNAKRVVVKLGTGILTSTVGCLDAACLEQIAAQIAELKQRGLEVIVVSSGAVGLGMGRLGLTQRPSRLAAQQACAAVGQSILTETWQGAFTPHNIIVAQLLLTRDDVRGRRRHVAVRDLLEELISEGIVPIINENDSVSKAELELLGFGDNDVLSSLVASLVKADLLAILSTAPGVIDRLGSGEIIPYIERISAEIEALAGGSESATGTGGMVTKLEAARIATMAGATVFIGHGKEPDILLKLLGGEAVGTIFAPGDQLLNARHRWIAHFQESRGLLKVDAGAARALQEKGSSLLAKGIIAAEGEFDVGDVVSVADPDGVVFARGVVHFDQATLQPLLGKSNAEIAAAHPDLTRMEIIHRDELVLMRR
ncbi:glutamate 5-kinase [Cerasicoccus fimbriatus]|uniref:glutamate 5-kinase n=1 Tax=Cerasicoccus fimbriatus TaxID=3014554 RepID=UPI0022B450F3|nr:glutamate 5-kinase [Cerasicoccus sp. TK19100]